MQEGRLADFARCKSPVRVPCALPCMPPTGSVLVDSFPCRNGHADMDHEGPVAHDGREMPPSGLTCRPPG
jgi:hypothetical protein